MAPLAQHQRNVTGVQRDPHLLLLLLIRFAFAVVKSALFFLFSLRHLTLVFSHNEVARHAVRNVPLLLLLLFLPFSWLLLLLHFNKLDIVRAVACVVALDLSRQKLVPRVVALRHVVNLCCAVRALRALLLLECLVVHAVRRGCELGKRAHEKTPVLDRVVGFENDLKLVGVDLEVRPAVQPRVVPAPSRPARELLAPSLVVVPARVLAQLYPICTVLEARSVLKAHPDRLAPTGTVMMESWGVLQQYFSEW